MPFIIAVLSIFAGVYFFVIRTRNATHMAGELLGVANDVRLAARRFGFRRKSNIHPVENIEDPHLAIGAIATAFIELDGLPTKEQRNVLISELMNTLAVDNETANEITILGHWFITECNGPQPAVTRLARKLFKLQGADAFPPLLEVLNATLVAGSGGLNRHQKDALDEVKRAFHIT